jgi:hypothetical protein
MRLYTLFQDQWSRNQNKAKISRLVDIEVFEGEYASE